jgi:cytochrome c biogenesis protein CcdA/thiol-disulfide isomerase/thioredoxin
MMILWVLAYLGGLLTILSPCILPVLPFVLSRAEQPFRRSGLPLLAGMATMFAVVSTLAVVGGSWVVRANEGGRWVAMGVLSLFALSLLFPSVAEWMSRPFTRLGGTLHQKSTQESSLGNSFLLGAATGLLWAPCAGPILGLILTSAALHGAQASTSLLLLSYALGAATSLAVVLWAGRRVFQQLRRYLGVDAWVRRFVGTAVLLGVLAIALGWDRGTLTQLSRFHTESVEQKLIHWLHGESTSEPETPMGSLPEFDGAEGWINSPPLTSHELQGKVVLVDFWTYSCINCLRTLPHIKAWAQKYKDMPFVIIGVHTPEFAFEKNITNVQKAVRELGVSYPVAIDNHYKVWNAFHNRYWPAHYFIDAQGKIRHVHFGEGDEEASERIIQELLAEAGAKNIPTGFVHVGGDGTQASSLKEAVASHETYLGYNRSQHQVSRPEVRKDQAETYQFSPPLELNQWSLGGRWVVKAENAQLLKAPGKIIFRFHARDLHLVLGSGPDGKPISFVVTLDGHSPGPDHGTDTDASGRGTIKEQRLYQLIRQSGTGDIQDRLFEIEFSNPGAEAFAFTFG